LKRVLFLCTGNYYRSRFAEELFNVLAPRHGLEWQADSAGLEPSPLNPGPISRHTLAACARLRIERPQTERFPRKVTAQDFISSNLVIAVKEAEHRTMMERWFPEYVPQVEFWHVHDIDCSEPDDTIAALEQRVDELIERLRQLKSEGQTTAA
jgi:protein-tyrosine phosphatase